MSYVQMAIVTKHVIMLNGIDLNLVGIIPKFINPQLISIKSRARSSAGNKSYRHLVKYYFLNEAFS